MNVECSFMLRPYFSLAVVSRWLFLSAFLAISLLAFLPDQAAVVTTGWDKANHFLAFLVLLWLLDMGWRLPRTYKFLLLLFYGLMIEWVQGMLPPRSVSAWDVFADVTGMVCYLLGRRKILLWSARCHRWVFGLPPLTMKDEER